MGILAAILILVLLGLVVWVVGAPLRARRNIPDIDGQPQPGRAATATSLEPQLAREDLEAAREAKYREIRDSELDFRTGKLSAEDYAAIDEQLRAEALAILDRLQELEAARPRDA
ncbi:MAG: hypothetical protein H0X28_13415 [Solirubrobacterales bacterium]|nr:hypothetical protein [Solirubrobacterales bacterium]